MQDSTVSRLEERIRDIINEPRQQKALLQDRASCNQICSSLDVIGDADLAIAAHSNRECGHSPGALYIAAYGVLQALFIQQDAVFHLCEALGRPDAMQNHPKLQAIREVRNASIGHPTKRDRKKADPVTFHFISRPTLDYEGFHLLSSDGAGNYDFSEVSITRLIEEQRESIVNILLTLVQALEAEMQEHRLKFRGEKLETVFASSSYFIEKMSEAVYASEPAYVVVGRGGLEQIKRQLGEFQASLAGRGIQLDTYPPIEYVYAELEHPLSQLERYFDEETANDQLVIGDDARIYIFYVQAKIKTLIDIAREIDEEYGS